MLCLWSAASHAHGALNVQPCSFRFSAVVCDVCRLQGNYCLTLEFKNAIELQQWQDRLPKIQTFFGPGESWQAAQCSRVCISSVLVPLRFCMDAVVQLDKMTWPAG